MPSDTAAVLAVDVGGTAIKAAALDRGMAELASARTPTPHQHRVEAVVGAVAELAERLSGLARDQGYEPAALGLAVPGIVDEARGVSVFAANLGWRDVPVRDLVASRTGLPVALGHDVRAGGIAEATFGAASGMRDVLFLPIGTGIAAAAIVDGHPLVAGGYAGEIGHVVVAPDGERCACGLRGCLETVSSATAIARRYSARSGCSAEGAVDVARRVEAGDPDAAQVWSEAIDALATALGAAVGLLGSEVVVVGGGLAEAGELLLDPLRRALGERQSFQRRPQIVRATLGERAGCLGAGLLAWRQFGNGTT